jgi:phage terminase small subunit
VSPKQARFVAEYLIDLNATQAAIRAGYSEKTANRIASHLLSKVDIADAVAAGKAKQLQSADVSAVRVLRELSRIAFSDLRDMFTDAGNLKSPDEWSDEAAAAISGIELDVKRTRKVSPNDSDGTWESEGLAKIKRWDKLRALEMLAKHLGVLKDAGDGGGQPTATSTPPNAEPGLSDA